VRQAISVVNKRHGMHQRTIREMAFGSNGLRIGEPLKDFHGVLTGVPLYTGAASPLLAQFQANVMD
jgi:circadian clock protein KaiC